MSLIYLYVSFHQRENCPQIIAFLLVQSFLYEDCLVCQDWIVSWNQLSGLMKEDGHWMVWNCLMVYLNSLVAICAWHVGRECLLDGKIGQNNQQSNNLSSFLGYNYTIFPLLLELMITLGSWQILVGFRKFEMISTLVFICVILMQGFPSVF